MDGRFYFCVKTYQQRRVLRQKSIFPHCGYRSKNCSTFFVSGPVAEIIGCMVSNLQSRDRYPPKGGNLRQCFETTTFFFIIKDLRRLKIMFFLIYIQQKSIHFCVDSDLGLDWFLLTYIEKNVTFHLGKSLE